MHYKGLQIIGKTVEYFTLYMELEDNKKSAENETVLSPIDKISRARIKVNEFDVLIRDRFGLTMEWLLEKSSYFS